MSESKEVITTELTVGDIKAGVSLFFDVAKFEFAGRVAKVFATSTMVPEQFRNNIGNCIIALNLADRMQTDPFMLMQNMYIIKGKPSIEAKLAIALVNNSGKFTALQYKYNKDKTNCYAFAKSTSTGEECKGATVSIQMAIDEGWAVKSNSKWKTMPELMLMYRAAMFFVRVYCPEALFGMQSKEETFDVEQPGFQLEKNVQESANKEVIDISPEEMEFKHEVVPESAQKSEDISPNLEMSEEEKSAIEAEEAGQGGPDF